MNECVWAYCPGTERSHWAYTPCRPGYNYLSKISPCKPYVGVADWYTGRMCPICGKNIRMDYARIVMEENNHERKRSTALPRGRDPGDEISGRGALGSCV